MNINSYRYMWIDSRSFDVSNNLRLFESFASWEPYKIRRERKFCNRESFVNFRKTRIPLSGWRNKSLPKRIIKMQSLLIPIAETGEGIVDQDHWLFSCVSQSQNFSRWPRSI